ncbi:MAG TPA: thioredoxin family protein [Flavobacteriaceae bacterium]|nr:thioredoxin family protein [Flavobacteriaceae bacterium]MCB9212951.1 thioredoxin family protein [Alteromonas sp.]HPF11377.1 thioredoxin family protein [Flavobacteriaceae bacterium]HQU20540.1 thioredoxin family protein [Flavobacteriaceae bacterium]HQU65827.1 thioredoxin family protein [Flavobacteriaceae bacterium]
MKKILFVALGIIFSFQLNAQDWQTNLDTAKSLAQQKQEPIILVFQGSDWCAPCIKLDREVWSSETFKNYAKEHYVMLQADFPKKKKNALPETQQRQNQLLAEKYNKQGIFPFVVILDSEGKVLGETGYKKLTPQAYINHLNTFIK